MGHTTHAQPRLPSATPQSPAVRGTARSQHTCSSALRWFQSAAAQIDVPTVEVALHGDPDVLLDRARARAASGQVHEIKASFKQQREGVTWSPRSSLARPRHPHRQCGMAVVLPPGVDPATRGMVQLLDDRVGEAMKAAPTLAA
jgi:hypothetical protein